MPKYQLPVSEQFHSIQGEGKTMGVPAYFLRLRSCNILCGGKGTDKDKQLHDGATWRCDTIEVWLKGKPKTFDQVIADFGPEFVKNLKSRMYHLVVTGGEPLLHCEGINDFVAYTMGTDTLRAYLEIETNGTLMPGAALHRKVSQYNISPKLANSGVPKDKRIVPAVLEYFAECESSTWKFVVKNRKDVMEVVTEYLIPFGIDPLDVYLMPAADNAVDLQKVSLDVAEICRQEGFKFSSRLHVAIWDKKTGV